MILPERVLGRSGHEHDALRAGELTDLRVDHAVELLGEVGFVDRLGGGGLQMTKAMRPWPLRSCFTPMTADSATAASSMKIASSSAVPMR